MQKGMLKRSGQLLLIVLVLFSVIYGGLMLKSPFTQAAFANGYPGGNYATCCSVSSDCPGKMICCKPVGNEVGCTTPNKPDLCKNSLFSDRPACPTF
jgi:hypothetical protein